MTGLIILLAVIFVSQITFGVLLSTENVSSLNITEIVDKYKNPVIKIEQTGGKYTTHLLILFAIVCFSIIYFSGF